MQSVGPPRPLQALVSWLNAAISLSDPRRKRWQRRRATLRRQALPSSWTAPRRTLGTEMWFLCLTQATEPWSTWMPARGAAAAPDHPVYPLERPLWEPTTKVQLLMLSVQLTPALQWRGGCRVLALQMIVSLARDRPAPSTASAS